MIRKTLRWTAAVLLLVVVAGVLTVLLRWDRTFEAPLPDIVASTDPDVIAAGWYLAYGPAHCANCHVPPELHAALERGEEPPLSGGVAFHPPPGTFRTPNLTPDRATGIGAVSDGQLARVLRYGVRRDGLRTWVAADAGIVVVVQGVVRQFVGADVRPDHFFRPGGKGG